MKTHKPNWLVAAGALGLTATGMLLSLSGGENHAVAQELDPDPVPHVEATPTSTCKPDAPWRTVGERPGLNVTEWKCLDEEWQPVYNAAAHYSQERDNPCNPTRSCDVRWSHIGPIPVQETRIDPDTGQPEEHLVAYKYIFTETDSCGNAQVITPMLQDPHCCPPAGNN